MFPVSPTCKVFAWLNMYVASNGGGKLIYKFDCFYWLQYGPNKFSAVGAHIYFNRATKRRAHSNSTSAVKALFKRILKLKSPLLPMKLSDEFFFLFCAVFV